MYCNSLQALMHASYSVFQLYVVSSQTLLLEEVGSGDMNKLYPHKELMILC